MPNIDLKYARSNTTGTSGEGGSEQPRGEEGERAGELLRDRSEWQPVGPSVRLAVAGCAGPSDGRIRHEIVGKDILREKPLLSSSLHLAFPARSAMEVARTSQWYHATWVPSPWSSRGAE